MHESQRLATMHQQAGGGGDGSGGSQSRGKRDVRPGGGKHRHVSLVAFRVLAKAPGADSNHLPVWGLDPVLGSA